jgi:hypothetical protein
MIQNDEEGKYTKTELRKLETFNKNDLLNAF